MQMGETRGSVDVLRVSRLGRDPAVEGLADLADHHEIVHCALSERAEQIIPWRRQRLVSQAENIAKVQPWVGRPTDSAAWRR